MANASYHAQLDFTVLSYSSCTVVYVDGHFIPNMWYSLYAQYSIESFYSLIGPWEMWQEFKKIIFQTHFMNWYLEYFFEISLRWVPRNQLMIRQHWFRQWLVAIRQQAITWANVDQGLCHHMASHGHNELNRTIFTVLNSSMVGKMEHTFLEVTAYNGNLNIHSFLILWGIWMGKL